MVGLSLAYPAGIGRWGGFGRLEAVEAAVASQRAGLARLVRPGREGVAAARRGALARAVAGDVGRRRGWGRVW